MRITTAKLTQISIRKPTRPKTEYNISSDDWLGFLGGVTVVLCSVGVETVLKLVKVESVVTIKVGTGEGVLEAAELCSCVVVATIRDGVVIDELLYTEDKLGCTSTLRVGLAVEYEVVTKSVGDSVGISINVAHLVFEFRNIPGQGKLR